MALVAQEAVGGLSNEGYWGVPVQAGRQYALSMYISSAQASRLALLHPSHTSSRGVARGTLCTCSCSDAAACNTSEQKCATLVHTVIVKAGAVHMDHASALGMHGKDTAGRVYHRVPLGRLQQDQGDSVEADKEQWVRVALVSQDGRTTYASVTFMVSATFPSWELYNATMSPQETDMAAKLTIAFQVPKASTLRFWKAPMYSQHRAPWLPGWLWLVEPCNPQQRPSGERQSG